MRLRVETSVVSAHRVRSGMGLFRLTRALRMTRPTHSLACHEDGSGVLPALGADV